MCKRKPADGEVRRVRLGVRPRGAQSGVVTCCRHCPWKDYRGKGRVRYKRMTLCVEEFIRRLLLHVLPAGLHRIRHYGLLANTTRRDNLARARELLMCSSTSHETQETTDAQVKDTEGAHEARGRASATYVCPDCGTPMIIIETFERTQLPRAPPAGVGDS